MDDLAKTREAGVGAEDVGGFVEVFGDEVFDGLHIMAGGGFEVCEAPDLGLGERTRQGAQVFAFGVAQARGSG